MKQKQRQKRLPKKVYLTRSNGVTMAKHDQAPVRCNYGSSQPGPETVAFMPTKWHGHGSGSTKLPSDSVALGRSRGMTGSDMTKSPSDLVALAYQEVLHWFGHDQAPK